MNLKFRKKSKRVEKVIFFREFSGMNKFIVFLLCMFSIKLFAILPDPVKEFNYEKTKLLQPALMEKYAANKNLDSEFELPSLLALSYYPELKSNQIRFQQKNIKTTMQCVPKLNFIFRKKENRIYAISIDNKIRNKKGLLLKDVPFNAQVGVIGHELAHVVDYNSKTNMGIIFLGIGYLLPKKRRQVENRVDEITIAHGLGHQVKNFSNFVLNNEDLNERYLKYKRKYYYSPKQLMQVMLKYPIY